MLQVRDSAPTPQLQPRCVAWHAARADSQCCWLAFAVVIAAWLQFHPSKRITVDEALAHSYFDSVRSQYTDPEPVLPLGPGGFHFEFENG